MAIAKKTGDSDKARVAHEAWMEHETRKPLWRTLKGRERALLIKGMGDAFRAGWTAGLKRAPELMLEVVNGKYPGESSARVAATEARGGPLQEVRTSPKAKEVVPAPEPLPRVPLEESREAQGPHVN